MEVKFNEEKNELLKKIRGVCFDDVINAIEKHNILDIVPNENYHNQKNLILKINNYVYVSPFVEDNGKIFLKTVFPSRKHNKIYNS